jgi:hypothetical protein
MSEKSTSHKAAGIAVGIATAVTGVTQRAEVKNYVRSERASESARTEETTRSIETEAKSSNEKTEQND